MSNRGKRGKVIFFIYGLQYTDNVIRKKNVLVPHILDTDLLNYDFVTMQQILWKKITFGHTKSLSRKFRILCDTKIHKNVFSHLLNNSNNNY